MAEARPGRLRCCLVTNAHIANNPRLVKEADALAAAGHDVRVVAAHVRDDIAHSDDVLMRDRPWRLQRFDVRRRGARGRWLRDSLVQRFSRALFARGLRHPALADRALTRHLDLMLTAVVAEPADVVLGHNAPALPVAVMAAHRLGARAGFDIEDLHTSELGDRSDAWLERMIIADAERRWLPRCDLLTASSPGIADEIVRLYGVRRPHVVLNVFPLAERNAAVSGVDVRAPDTISLYWYSQVIGAGRGLEDAVRALALLPAFVHLYVRGHDDGFGHILTRDAERLGVGERLHVLPPVMPHELVPRAAMHDIGLALEQPNKRNRELCLSNKLFTYLLAGLAVVATDTPAQRSVIEQVGEAGALCRPGDPADLASTLRPLVTDPARLRAARHAARIAADQRFNWDAAADDLVEYVTVPPKVARDTGRALQAR